MQAEGHELADEDVDEQKPYLAPVFKFDEQEHDSALAEAEMMDDVLNGKKVSAEEHSHFQGHILVAASVISERLSELLGRVRRARDP